jgi:endonuclease/exonuclease/phosphatase family metal-dependent hydrolase
MTRFRLPAAGRLLLYRATPRNYPHPAEPRYAGGRSSGHPGTGTLKVVTFNVKFARHPDRAVALLRETEALRDPDLLLLQEMDAPGARAIAGALGLAYVYYPAAVHPIPLRDFGNAILSRYPIEDDRKIVLPHLARFRLMQRTAVAATVRVGEQRLRVYCVHLATMVDNGPKQRREQLKAVLEDAEGFQKVLLAGDFNSDRVPAVALARGFTWPTRRLGPTNAIWALDHVLLKGLKLEGERAYGSVRDVRRASDHKPVWARVSLDGG